MSPPTQNAARLPGSDLPSEWLLPEEDDMGHSFLQAELIFYLVSLLRHLFARDGKPWFVGFDQHIALSPTDARYSVAPDVYVLPQPQAPSAAGATWSPGDNGGVVPLVAFELVSRSNRKKDYAVAPDKYARLGVGELIVFEPWEQQPGLRVEGDVETFRVYRFDKKNRWSCVSEGDGPVHSQALDLWLHDGPGGTLRLTEDFWGKRQLLAPTELFSVEAAGRRLAEQRAEAEAEARKKAEASAIRATARASREARARQREISARLQAESALLSAETGALLRGKAEAILLVLAARGLAVSPRLQARVRSCSEEASLDTWLARAATAKSIEDVLAVEEKIRGK